MYTTYAEWGPAKNRTDDLGSTDQRAALSTALDLRDSAGERPDDN